MSAAATNNRDSQLVELIGRNWLVAQLLRDGIEVAVPERDRGIDLLVYLDTAAVEGRFVAYPVQLKASTAFNFGFDRKYERFPNLLFAFVWHLDDPQQTEAACLTAPEVIDIAETLGWTTTASWSGTTASAHKGVGGYSTRHRSARLKTLLEPHRMQPGSWLAKLHGLAGGH